MNQICKKLLVLTSLLFSTLLFTNQALATSAPGTTEDPTALLCSFCSSSADFTNYAKFNTPNNTGGYYLIANVDSRIVKQVYSWKAWEPELGISLGRAYIVTLLPEHQLSFDKHLTWIDDGSQLETFDVDAENSSQPFPGFGAYIGGGYIPNNVGDLNNYQAFGRHQFFISRGSFGALQPVVFKITFKNGDIAWIYSAPGAKVPALLILAINDEGVIIGTPGEGSTGGTPQGPSPFFSTPIGFSGDSLECRMEEPAVICKVVPPEGEE